MVKGHFLPARGWLRSRAEVPKAGQSSVVPVAAAMEAVGVNGGRGVLGGCPALCPAECSTPPELCGPCLRGRTEESGKAGWKQSEVQVQPIPFLLPAPPRLVVAVLRSEGD